MTASDEVHAMPGDGLAEPARAHVLTLSARQLFILLGVLAVVVILGIRVQSLVSERDRILEQRRAQAATLAQFAATYSARLYDQSAHVAREIAAYVRDTNPSPQALHEYLAARTQDTSLDDYIVVLDRDGRLSATSETSAPAGLKLGDGNAMAQWRRDELQIVPVLRSRLTGSVIYSLGVRLDDRNGAFAGVVGVNVRPEGIKPTAERGPDAPLLSVWGQDGRFIAASFVDFDPTGRVVRPPTPPGLGIPGSPPRRDGGIEASALVPGWPLVAVASYDVDGVLAGWRREVLENLALAGLVVLGVGALVWFGVRTADREEVAKRAALSAKATADAALKARDLLLKEVHHRVKNSLMMTSSLIYLQEREFADPEVRAAFEQTRRRLNSIGLVHEALYSGSSLEEVDLAGYLQRLLDEIAEGHGAAERGIRIVTEIEPLSLAPNQVTPVGLIVAEVITNAFKHAFGVNGSGVIKVTARLLNFNDIEIEVRDDGKGYAPPEGEGAKGLGTRLIAALSDQLGGVLSLSNAGGAAFRITFPRMTHGGQARAGDA